MGIDNYKAMCKSFATNAIAAIILISFIVPVHGHLGVCHLNISGMVTNQQIGFVIMTASIFSFFCLNLVKVNNIITFSIVSFAFLEYVGCRREALGDRGLSNWERARQI